MTAEGHAAQTFTVAYVLKRFPRLTETFILNEILELERQGIAVEIFSLLRPPIEERHALLESLRAPVTYLPRSSVLDSWKLLVEGGDGKFDKLGVESFLAGSEPPLAELFPGKQRDEIIHMCLQALTLGLAASARGVQHLHAHFGSNATTVALLASRVSGIPYSFTAHARDIYHTYVDRHTDDRLRRQKIAESRFVITVSDYNRRHLAQLAGNGAAAKIHRLYNGIDLARFSPSMQQRESARFLAVGRLVEKKGFRHLVEACRILKSQHRRFSCQIVGRGPDRERLQDQITAAGLDACVSLIDAMPQERLVALMQEASTVVLPCVVSASGDRDGLPTVLLEGLAMGLPAISTSVAGVPEIIEHERSGLLVAPESPDQLADAMAKMMANDALRRRMGRAARRKAEQDFDLHRNVGILRHLFTHSAMGEVRDTEDALDENRLCHSG